MFCSDDPTDFVVEYNSVFLSETKKAQVEKIIIHPQFNMVYGQKGADQKGADIRAKDKKAQGQKGADKRART